MKIVLALTAAFALAVALSPVPASAENKGEVDVKSTCYVCAAGSACQECKFDGHDLESRREACRVMGCTIVGTNFCSTKKDVKVCAPAN